MEISEKEISEKAKKEYKHGCNVSGFEESAFIEGAKWMQQQLKIKEKQKVEYFTVKLLKALG